MFTEIETLAARRRRILAWYVSGYALWMGSQIVRGMITGHSWDYAIAATGLIGAAAWIIGSWEIYQLQKYLKGRPRMAAALNDERIQRDRLMAAFDALGIVTILNGVCIAILAFAPNFLSGLVLAQLNVATAVVAFIGSFLRRDAAGVEDEE